MVKEQKLVQIIARLQLRNVKTHPRPENKFTDKPESYDAKTSGQIKN